ncbi:MAG: glutathione peroxidase [Planctomycetaceae bacterium]
MNSFRSLMLVPAVIAGGVFAAGSAAAGDSFYEFDVKSLAGDKVDLAQYKGKVLLVVNVASKCGATEQYKQLQEMYDKHKEEGLVVLGFPCNQFGGQEPGSAKEIQEFCSSTYAVKFPMFSKIDVNGSEEAPLYGWLKKHAEDHTDIGWNFEKFVIGRDGNVVARFKTRTKPDAPEVIAAIEKELAKAAAE